MVCPVKECEHSEDCIIRELIKKDPPKNGCSYFGKSKKKKAAISPPTNQEVSNG